MTRRGLRLTAAGRVRQPPPGSPAPGGGQVAGAGLATLLTGLVAYWKLDEASGTRFDAASTNHLTDNNTVTQAVGKLAQAAQFTAANLEYLSIADNAALSMGDIDFSIALWLYLDSGGANRCLVAKGDLNAAATAEFSLEHNSNVNPTLAWFVGNGTTSGVAEHATALSTATWYWVYAYHDASANEIGVRLNNGTAATAAYASGSYDSAHPLNVGRWPVFASGYLDGRLDAIGIWKRLLTTDERSQLYNGGAGLDYPFV